MRNKKMIIKNGDYIRVHHSDQWHEVLDAEYETCVMVKGDRYIDHKYIAQVKRDDGLHWMSDLMIGRLLKKPHKCYCKIEALMAFGCKCKGI